MSKATRKHITPGVLATALGVVAALALMAAVTWLPGAAQAQSGPASPFAPAAPTGVTATVDSATQITVTWTAGVGGAAVTGYEVERKVGDGAFMGVDPAHPGTDPTYTDTNVSAGMTYTYRVRAQGSGAQASRWAESDAVTVPSTDGNNAPVATGSISDLSLRINTSHGPIDITGEFEDADGDTLTYTADSDNPNVADAVVPNGMLTVTAGSVRGSARITVTADDGNGGTVPISFTVTVSENYTLTADPMRAPMLPAAPAAPATDPYAALRALPADAIFVVTDLGAYDAKFHLAVAGSEDDVTVTVTASEPDDGGITITDSDGLIGAGFVDEEETDLEGSLTVKATDQGSRAFEIEGVCETVGAWATISVEDKDLDLVAEGAIYCKAPDEPDDVITTSDDCYSIVGNPDEMRDDLDDPTTATADAEIGQDTVQVLNGSSSVQLTVTACKEGPVYIRFIDSAGKVFGTDVDECPTCSSAAGADVVGLDSQRKLELNLSKTMTAAEALMYDQYTLVSINPDTNPMERLTGKAGDYHMGKFRFNAPCDWAPFKVEVYEPEGKTRVELQNGMMYETVSCVPAMQAEAEPIEVVQGSRANRAMIVRWQPIESAVNYTVAVIDTSNASMYTIAFVRQFGATATREVTVPGLNSGTRYIYAVYASLPDGNYSPVEWVINTPEFQ